MATKPRSSGWSNSLRKGFNLEAEEQEQPLTQTEEAATTPPTQDAPATVDLVPLTNNTRPSAPSRERGRPKSTVERFPKTVYLTPIAELALRRSVEQMQDWRGRRRGVLKVQESEAANFALEYLYRRMSEGVEAAEAFYGEFQASERSRFETGQSSPLKF